MSRVLAAIVVPPHLSVSGGARAAEQLSAALAPRCDMTVASMMNGASAGEMPVGPRHIRRLEVRTWSPPLVPWSRLPNRYSTLFYRSNLPDLGGPLISQGLEIQVRTTEPTVTLYRLTDLAVGHHVALQGLSVSRPSLEDVYLELVGGDERPTAAGRPEPVPA